MPLAVSACLENDFYNETLVRQLGNIYEIVSTDNI